jgi:hypothetical protein
MGPSSSVSRFEVLPTEERAGIPERAFQRQLSFYPGQLHAFQLTPPAAALAGGNDEETLGAEVLDEAFVEEELPSGWE